MYKIPENYFFRLHHVRPRFKNDVESVLLFMAEEIASMQELPRQEFAEILNSKIIMYPGNSVKTEKTINNWRTEISALFGFVINAESGFSYPGLRAKELAESEDLVQAFKKFLFTFQYPGHHVKSHEVAKMIEAGIHFKPAKAILQVLNFAEKNEGGRVFITKPEACHCLFNDLRCTRGTESPSETWQRIKQNRNLAVEYDQTGDVIRYAGDIIDYMVMANLLVSHNGIEYYLNRSENETILRFINSNEWFDEYDEMISNRKCDLAELNQIEFDWFEYVNKDMSKTDFSTNIASFITSDEEKGFKETSISEFLNKIKNNQVKTKDTGDFGESLVYLHECNKLKKNDRSDLVHLVKRIPTNFAVGYDISSVEFDGMRQRFIEVKTTISTGALSFSRVNLTQNEWRAAATHGERYFVYRLAINKEKFDLFIIQDPVGLYKKNIIDMIPKDGAEINFNVDTAGTFEELLV